MIGRELNLVAVGREAGRVGHDARDSQEDVQTVHGGEDGCGGGFDGRETAEVAGDEGYFDSGVFGLGLLGYGFSGGFVASGEDDVGGAVRDKVLDGLFSDSSGAWLTSGGCYAD